jgi:hypothetical protein
MTYPPQQPGPYGPQQPYGQQPQGPYGPNTPWSGQQPGFPMGPPPPKRKAGLIASLIIVAILVVGGGGVGLYFLLSNDKKESSANGGAGDDDKSDDPRAAADAYVKALEKAINTKDLADVDLKPLKPLTCKDDFTQLEDELESAQDDAQTASPEPRPKIDVSIDNFKADKKGATFTLVREADGDSDEREMDVLKESDSWRVCGLYRDDDSGGGGGGPTTSRPIPNPIPTT